MKVLLGLVLQTSRVCSETEWHNVAFSSLDAHYLCRCQRLSADHILFIFRSLQLSVYFVL